MLLGEEAGSWVFHLVILPRGRGPANHICALHYITHFIYFDIGQEPEVHFIWLQLTDLIFQQGITRDIILWFMSQHTDIMAFN